MFLDCDILIVSEPKGATDGKDILNSRTRYATVRSIIIEERRTRRGTLSQE